jgi:hypothetical protein
MFFPSATVVAALVISLAGVAPLEARTATRGAARSVSPAALKIAAGLWAPKKSRPRPARDEDPREEELLKSKSPAGGGEAAAPKRRRPIKMEEGQDEGEDDAEGDDDDDDEDKPKVTKRRKRVAEEEEEDVAEPISSQPSVIPRLVNFEIGTALMRRSFAFNQASLQKDKGVRLGYQLALESFPLVSQPSGWYRTLGVGAWYEKEYGDATQNGAGGMFTGYPFNQNRWGFDARYAIPAGDWVVIMPAVGYGRIGADLQRMTSTAPADCMSTSTDPCFGDVKASYLSADVHVRVGLTPTMAVSLSGGYYQGLGVSRGMDQITNQAPASMKGFHVDAGATMLLGDWFALQVTVPFRRYVFAFDAPMGSTFSYRYATDLYYGVIAGLSILTK